MFQTGLMILTLKDNTEKNTYNISASLLFQMEYSSTN